MKFFAASPPVILVTISLLWDVMMMAADGFQGPAPVNWRDRTRLHMGLFDGIKNAFSNEEFASPPEGIKATARHILVKSTEDADMILGQLGSGDAKFADLARQYSTCPSGASGGSLGISALEPWSRNSTRLFSHPKPISERWWDPLQPSLATI